MTIPNESALLAKENRLRRALRGYGSVVIGYSGGVDSAYLAAVVLEALGRDRVLAVTGRSPSYPEDQRAMARRVARQLDLPHLEIDTHELADPDYASNPSNRCYFCKSVLYRRLTELARERNFEQVIDGANADDAADYRPGAEAASELGVRSPLQELGLTKSEIRRLSKRRNLPTWEVPASPCLASRIAYGLPVTRERLGQVEQAERRLRESQDWRDFRVRHHGDWARLEVAPHDIDAFADPEHRARVVAALRSAGFDRACLDLQGYRRGALNETLVQLTAAP